MPSELWLQAIDITLTIQRSFEERTDLYQDQGGPLSRERWLAKDARYATSVFLQTQGHTDLRADGEANFVVIEDLTKGVGDTGKFLLLIWEDSCGSGAMLGTPMCWSQVKELYSN